MAMADGPVTFRRLTEDERRMIAAYRPGPPGLRDLLLLGVLVTALVLLPLVLLGRWVPLAGAGGLALPVAALAGVAAVVHRRRDHARRLAAAAPYLALHARDAERDEAEVTRYDVVAAVRVKEYEDEGSHWFLSLRDGRVLFLSGQYLYDVEDSPSFPSSAVEVARSPLGRVVLDVRGCGEPLAPAAELAPFPLERAGQGDLPSDGDVLERDFDAIRRGEAYGNAPRA